MLGGLLRILSGIFILALLLLYDITSKKSYDNIRAWLGEIREYAQDDVVVILIGQYYGKGI